MVSLNAPGRISFRPVFAREREVRYKKGERSPGERLFICKVNYLCAYKMNASIYYMYETILKFLRITVNFLQLSEKSGLKISYNFSL